MLWRSKIESGLGVEGAGIHSRSSAVLVLFVAGAPDHILLTKRTDRVETHKGQICFPGGFHEPKDPNLRTTALREFEEEMGAGTKSVTLYGTLPEVETLGGVTILPWVGEWSGPTEFFPSPEEVDRILYLPVDRLVEEGLSTVDVDVGSRTIASPGIRVDGELVWGATAKILQHLRDVLRS